MLISTDSNKIEELLTRGVENIYPKREFLEARLKEKKMLTLYTGYDPTADTLHIGHGITLLKLREFQDLGHKVIMLIGDFTGMIGDPTDKSAARKKLTREEVLKNCVKYKEQAAAILDFGGENSAVIKFNSEWLGKMNFADVLELAGHFTVQQMMERDMFDQRMSHTVICPNCKQENYFPVSAILLATGDLSNWQVDKDSIKVFCSACKIIDLWATPVRPITPSSKPIYLHEFLYPLMQGYDSVAMKVDGEIGGNDQTFNMLAGRTLMKEILSKEKFVLTIRLLADDGGKKMGKSEGNMIALSDTPEDMFGKVMRWSDTMILSGFDLCTRVEMPLEKEVKAEPMKYKKMLAYEITKTFLGEKSAEEGQARFAEVIQHKEVPKNIFILAPTTYDIITTLKEAGMIPSKAEGRRVIEQGGVKINDQKVVDFNASVKPGDVVQKGNRFFVRII